jgi:Protein of unknown function (DUF3667)
MNEQAPKNGPGKGTRRRTPDQPCLNCGDPTYAVYCPQCGQAKRTVNVSVGAMVMEVLEDQLILSRALPRTLLLLLTRPGRLTAEYVEGRVVRYIAPFRLYLVSSVLFFLALSFWSSRLLEDARFGDGAPDRIGAEGAEAARDAMAQIDTTELPPEARAALATAQTALAETEVAQDAAESAAAAAERDAVAPGQLQPWARNLEVSTGNAARDSMFRARIIERYGTMPPAQALREFLPDYISYVPHTVFLLLPIFALLLKLLYVRRGRYYSEHFVFALHTHAFVFLMFLIMLLARHWIVTTVLCIWIVVYIWMAMKRVYAQGWFRTTVKYWILGFVYFVLLNIGLAFTIFPTLLL